MQEQYHTTLSSRTRSDVMYDGCNNQDLSPDSARMSMSESSWNSCVNEPKRLIIATYTPVERVCSPDLRIYGQTLTRIGRFDYQHLYLLHVFTVLFLMVQSLLLEVPHPLQPPMHRPQHGIFLDSCKHHCGEWGNIRIDGDLQVCVWLAG